MRYDFAFSLLPSGTKGTMCERIVKDTRTNVKGQRSQTRTVEDESRISKEQLGKRRVKEKLYNQGSGEHIGAREIIGEIR